ncbi:MAG: hypothetical protein EPO09_13260 [Aquabacterium sp.]|uniref:hypothetical protein n=1 Tax=Aquabacterium sp. TaxID=1872578 RepID=UPI0012113245|nr:hypothetical protein [Aquabacterium sp.]TAK93256.1 MAG: hypothetical protein EPO09_13260 [Aquabacterium sp.]
MNTSSATSRTAPLFKMPRHGWMAVMGVFTATALTTVLLALGNNNDDHATGNASQRGNRPLFSGWIKPGTTEFSQDQTNRGAISTQPRWVLATEPSVDEIKDLQSALIDHPDKTLELNRLIDYSRFQKQVALWNELQNGPMNSERTTLSQHLLDVLPAHYSRGELMGPQALLMARTIVKDLEPNPQLQDARLAATTSQLTKQSPALDQDQSQDQSAAQKLAAQQSFESFEQQQRRIAGDHAGTASRRETRPDITRHAMLDNNASSKTP